MTKEEQWGDHQRSALGGKQPGLIPSLNSMLSLKKSKRDVYFGHVTQYLKWSVLLQGALPWKACAEAGGAIVATRGCVAISSLNLSTPFSSYILS